MEEQKVKTNKYSCASCGGTLVYAPEKQKLYCTKCETTKDIEFVPYKEKVLWENRNKGVRVNNMPNKQKKHLKCPNCGADVEINHLEFSKKCAYCNSSLVGVMSEETQIDQPDGIIPFKLSKQQSASLFTQGVKKKFFVPNAFKKAIPVENIKGFYIPSFSFDAKSKSTYTGVLEKDYKYRDSDGDTHTRTVTKPISGSHSATHTDVVVESSSLLNQVQMTDILPYNMKQVVEYKNEFILGYTVEQYEHNVEQCKQMGNRIMEDVIKKQILRGYSYDRVVSFNLNANFSEEKYSYYLLPVYNCKFNYKNKEYNTFMNGESGKVGGGFPISALKVTLTIILSILLFGGFIALILLLS